jgi:prefoldin subunit 5
MRRRAKVLNAVLSLLLGASVFYFVSTVLTLHRTMDDIDKSKVELQQAMDQLSEAVEQWRRSSQAITREQQQRLDALEAKQRAGAAP